MMPRRRKARTEATARRSRNQILASSSMPTREAEGEEHHAEVAVERCGLRADIGNNSPRQILCSSSSDIDSPSDTDHSSSETLFRGAEAIQKSSQENKILTNRSTE